MVGIAAEPPKTYRVKVILAGEPGVGKTSILSVLTKDAGEFPKNYNMTCGIELGSKQFPLPGTTDSVEFLFIDSGGHYLFDGLLKKAWPQNCLICLVYDMTRTASFERLNAWIENTNHVSAKGSVGLLLANKADLASRRFVTTSMGKEFAQKHKEPFTKHDFYHFSQNSKIKSKENVDLHEAFRALATEWGKKPKL